MQNGRGMDPKGKSMIIRKVGEEPHQPTIDLLTEVDSLDTEKKYPSF